MTLLVDNTLAGTVGELVTDTTLGDSAVVGTVTIETVSSSVFWVAYDDTHTVHGQPTIRLQSAYHRGNTPRLQVPLPQSGPWCVRWYTWVPILQDAGYGTDEVRWLADLEGTGLVVVETSAGHVAARLQPSDLSADWESPTVGGTNRELGRWLRLELRRTDNVSLRIFEGHETSPMRTATWSSPLAPSVLELSGYRYRRRPLLMWGDQGSQVAALQNELIDLGYDLSPWGADGDFGEGTHNVVMEFQADRGITPVDGAAGPETRAAMDMLLGHLPPPLYLSHLAVSDGEWVGPAELPPDPPTRTPRLVLGMPI